MQIAAIVIAFLVFVVVAVWVQRKAGAAKARIDDGLAQLRGQILALPCGVDELLDVELGVVGLEAGAELVGVRQLYEQRLIREAVVARTGQRFLAGLNSDEAMFRYLMDNAIASKQALNLSVGIIHRGSTRQQEGRGGESCSDHAAMLAGPASMSSLQ